MDKGGERESQRERERETVRSCDVYVWDTETAERHLW